MTPDPGTSGKPDMEHDPQLASLYRAGAAGEPPAHLDDAIRAAARREVAAGPRRQGFRRWSVPVSLAAVVVLSVSVVTMMRDEGADRPETLTLPPPVAIPAPSSAKPEATEPPASAPQRQVSPPAAAPVQPKTAVPAQKLSRQAEENELRKEERASAYDGSPSAGMAEEKAGPAEDVGGRRDQAPQRLMRRSAPVPMAADAAPAGATASQPAPAAALSAAPARQVLWQDLVEEPPEKWIQRMVELRRAGRKADAEALTAEFRRRFPDQHLPGDAR